MKLLIFPAIISIIFILLYRKNCYRIWIGYVFMLAVLSGLGVIAYIIIPTQNVLVGIILLVLLFLAFIIASLGIYFIIGFLFIKSAQLLKRESHSFANLLSTFLLIGIITQGIISIVFGKIKVPLIVNQLYTYLLMAEGIILFLVAGYLTMVVLVNIIKPRVNTDYIIVLGSGLIDGHKVSVLLGNRIDAAIKFYEKQKNKGRKVPKIIFSGGKGKDESISEAEAMSEYARDKGIPESDIILEERSLNTYQNFLYSKEIMDRLSESKYKCVFATSNYHVFRAGTYAHKVGLNAKGVGGKTAVYFAQNALIREFVAILADNKTKILIGGGIIVILGFIFAISNLLFA